MNAVELVLFLLSELSSHSGKTKTYVCPIRMGCIPCQETKVVLGMNRPFSRLWYW